MADPFLGLDSRDLLEIVLEASDKASSSRPTFGPLVFSVWLKSGFDAIEECFAT